jgi:septal ring factor EnvC (AmiA/AmiB activator)
MVDGLRSLQHQVTDMSANLTTRLDELQSRGVSPSPAVAYYGTEHRGHVETSVALSEIRSQLHELTRSLESCQSEVTEVKRDMVAIKNELDTVQQVKEEIEELREYVDRLELQSHRRKLRLLEQVTKTVLCVHVQRSACVRHVQTFVQLAIDFLIIIIYYVIITFVPIHFYYNNAFFRSNI